MPWKEADTMDLRTEFVTRALSNTMPFTHLCKEYGISSKTGYKWMKRYHMNGVNGLEDESRRPKSSPNQLSEDCVCKLISIRNSHDTWGPTKIHKIYSNLYGEENTPSLSSVRRVLEKAGYTNKRKVRHKSDTPRMSCEVEATAPNKLWTVDFKGKWYSSDRYKIEPLTVRDAYSKYVLCSVVLEKSDTAAVMEVFERLFYKYGLPCAIHSDNGTPFAASNSIYGLTRLSALWTALDIKVNRSRPGKPQDNGGHERMHGDLAKTVEYVCKGDLKEQCRALEKWRDDFNNVRPHEALGLATPAEFYKKSDRAYEGKEFELEYPVNYERRKVQQNGNIKFDNHDIMISTALRGWHIGLVQGEDGIYNVWFANMYLGRLNMETLKLETLKT